jgi:hypothetical protein
MLPMTRRSKSKFNQADISLASHLTLLSRTPSSHKPTISNNVPYIASADSDPVFEPNTTPYIELSAIERRS